MQGMRPMLYTLKKPYNKRENIYRPVYIGGVYNPLPGTIETFTGVSEDRDHDLYMEIESRR